MEVMLPLGIPIFCCSGGICRFDSLPCHLPDDINKVHEIKSRKELSNPVNKAKVVEDKIPVQVNHETVGLRNAGGGKDRMVEFSSRYKMRTVGEERQGSFECLHGRWDQTQAVGSPMLYGSRIRRRCTLCSLYSL